jgi:predicted N-acyltransferase
MSEPETSEYRAQWSQRIEEVPQALWDALAEPQAGPVLEWQWLREMERSGSVRPETGWLPLHLTIWKGSALAAAAPLYVKGHSEGEFVWDYLWAEVAGKIGVRYYPKLLGMSPATPVPGYRFLIAPGEDEQSLTEIMLSCIERICRDNNFGGVAFNYVDPSWRLQLTAHGFLAWRHQSFAWENPGYCSFEDYLAAFDKNQRRNIRRERRRLEEQGILLHTLTGEEISRPLLGRMYDFYEGTNAQYGPWAAKYLTREFFEGLHEGYRHRLLIVAACREGKPVEEALGMSFLLRKGDHLYGRYWGAAEHVDSLHFNACYYTPIEWAIEHGIRHFDPGIGSAHKLRRGFRAVDNWSLHRFCDPRMQRIMEANIQRINSMEQEQIEAMNEAIPFAEGRGAGPSEP